MPRSIGIAATIVVALSISLLSISGIAQEIRSVQPGAWNATATWNTGVIPDAVNATRVVIEHHVDILSGSSVICNELIVNDTLTIANDASLTLKNSAATVDMQVNGRWLVSGSFFHEDDAVVNGTSSGNTSFLGNSHYYYRWNTAGAIPVVLWHPTATFHVNAFDGNASVTSDTWMQNFGNVVYDCPAQGNFMDFNGRLRNIQGDFFIRNTNNHILRLGRGHSFTLNVGGNFIVDGPSEVWLGETGSAVKVIAGKNFEFRAQATASSYLTLSGNTQLEVSGNFILDTNYKLKFASSGGGQAGLLVGGDVYFRSGTIDALGNSMGSIVFNGTAPQRYERTNAAFVEGKFSFSVLRGAPVDLNTSLLYNTTGGNLEVFGELIVGSSDAGGPLQAGVNSNTGVIDGVIFHPDAVIRFRGHAAQFISSSTDLSFAEIVIDNLAGVTALGDVTTRRLTIEGGVLNTLARTLTVHENIKVETGCGLQSSGTLLCDGSADQEIDLNGSTITNLSLSGEHRNVTLTTRANIAGLISLGGSSLSLFTGDSIHLLSESVTSGGRVGPLLNGNSVSGKITYERYMPAGRVYRYLALPVHGARVSDLMDDFAVTGSFQNPSTGPGINSLTPSLFYFDAASASWLNHPADGAAEDCLMTPGRGYSAFIRSASAPVTWDVTGEINHGDITFPVVAANGTAPGWNLVGNPYPCAIGWNNAGWTRQGIGAGIAVKDNNTGSFRIWDGAVGDLEDGIIAPGQAFWVRATTPTPELTATELVKQTDRGEFYRTDVAPDFIQITVSQSGHKDHAWLRQVRGSSGAFDALDIPKLKGDHISIAIATWPGQRLALSAMEELECFHQERLEITAENTTDTIYVAIKAQGIFEMSDLTLKDPSTDAAIRKTDDGRFVVPPGVTTLIMVVASASTEQLQTRLSDYICDGKTINATILDYTTRNQYRIEELNESIITRGVLTLSDSISFHYTQGARYRIISRSGCDADTTVLQISERRPPVPADVEEIRCGPGSVSFFLAAMEDKLSYNWYHGNGLVLANSGSYTTPVLEKGAAYRVRTVDLRNGCESDPATASARIEIIDSLEITNRGHEFSVNASPPLEWYRNGELLAITDSVISIKNEGIYRVRKVTEQGACAAQAYYDYRPMPVSVYPNPTNSYVEFTHSPNTPILKDILSVNGVSVLYLCSQVCAGDTCRLDVRSLSSGTYFLIFNSQGKFFRTCISVN